MGVYKMTNFQEPIYDVAQLAHVEILSPKLEESVEFFTRFLGMEVTARAGESVYLRAYEDFYHNTLKITEAEEAGLGHVAGVQLHLKPFNVEWRKSKKQDWSRLD